MNEQKINEFGFTPRHILFILCFLCVCFILLVLKGCHTLDLIQRQKHLEEIHRIELNCLEKKENKS